MAENGEPDDRGTEEICHRNRHQSAAGKGRKPGPGRPRKAPAHCRYAGYTQRRGHRYQPCPRIDGRHVYGKTGTYEEAAAEAVRMVERARTSAGVKFITLQQGCQDVLDTVRNRDGTWRSYDENFQTLIGFFDAETPLHEITPERVKAFIEHRRALRVRDKVVSDGRIRKNLGALGRVFNLAIKCNHFCGASPLDRVEWPKSNKVQVDDMHYDVAELEEITRTLRGRKERTAPAALRLVLLFFFTGFRRDELCKIKINQIDGKAGLIRTVEGKTGPRNFPICKPLLALLDAQIADRTGHLIPAGKPRGPREAGNRPRTDLERREFYVEGIFYRFRKHLRPELHSRFHPHTMRHSIKTFLEANGVQPHVSDRALGHAPKSVADRYRHATPLEIRTQLQRALDPLLYLVDPTVQEQPSAAQA
jgi:integrase